MENTRNNQNLNYINTNRNIIIENPKSIEEVVENYGNDWTHLIIRNLGMVFDKKKDLSKIRFPKDKDFFKNIRGGEIRNVVMPILDYSIYNFEDIIFETVEFIDGSDLPKDFFKKINFYASRGIELPSLDYREFDFLRARLTCHTFGRNSILPYDLFEKISTASAKNSLPPLDFSSFIMTEKAFECFRFHEDSIFPNKRDFFKVNYTWGMMTKLPKLDLNKYDLSNIKVRSIEF